MKERKIPKKNYIIYGIIVIVTLVAVFYINEWYKAYKKSMIEKSYISKYVTEMNYNEFENYIKVTPNAIVYISKTNFEESIQIEKNLYKIIKDNELIGEVVFLNLNDNENKFDDIIYNYYSLTNKINLDRIPAIAIFNNSRIIDMIASNNKNQISKSDILKLLEGNDYIK